MQIKKIIGLAFMMAMLVSTNGMAEIESNGNGIVPELPAGLWPVAFVGISGLLFWIRNYFSKK